MYRNLHDIEKFVLGTVSPDVNDKVVTVNCDLAELSVCDSYTSMAVVPQSGDVSVLVSDGVTDGPYRLNDHFTKVASVLNSSGIYFMFEPIVNKEDGWLNTLLHTVDNRHVRYFRVEEYVAAGSEELCLQEYVSSRREVAFTIAKPILARVEAQLESMPAEVLGLLDPHIKDGKLILSIACACFVWRA